MLPIAFRSFPGVPCKLQCAGRCDGSSCSKRTGRWSALGMENAVQGTPHMLTLADKVLPALGCPVKVVRTREWRALRVFLDHRAGFGWPHPFGDLPEWLRSAISHLAAEDQQIQLARAKNRERENR